eukprot:TRINITY_DN55511_c0_g1_i1.p1 TRINITY_DN55511_c0_g1~~TRINITY_DN55511_c0_g1_i1.p1  ORF type:complete len:488 (-),score=60.59 TRINITY_DN55511_c0_g1_i1:836-2299(-)
MSRITPRRVGKICLALSTTAAPTTSVPLFVEDTAELDEILAAAKSKLRIKKKGGHLLNSGTLQPLQDLSVLKEGYPIVLTMEAEQKNCEENSETSHTSQRADKNERGAVDLTWVPILTGKLALWHRPGKKAFPGLKAAGCTTVVTLLYEKEGAGQVITGTKAAGMNSIWCSVAGGSPEHLTSHAAAIADGVQQTHDLLAKGENVMVHCSAGMHRTGCFAWTLLRYIGLSKDEAMETLFCLRKATAEGVGEKRIAIAEKVVLPVLVPELKDQAEQQEASTEATSPTQEDDEAESSGGENDEPEDYDIETLGNPNHAQPVSSDSTPLCDPEEGFVLFHSGSHWGSQWHPSAFVVDGQKYNCAEQYMMAEKARMFGDDVARTKILNTAIPREQKAFGRGVQGFKKSVWSKGARQVVLQGNMAKFSQNEELKAKLLATGNKVIAEASSSDTVWGIGLKASQPQAKIMSKWRGGNWLGEVLMRTRAALKESN